MLKITHSCFSQCDPSILTVSLGRRLGTLQPVTDIVGWKEFGWEGSLDRVESGIRGQGITLVMTLVLM